MASRRTTEPEEPQRRPRPATTPEGRENQLVAMAIDLAEKRIMNGTASAAEIVHYLKLGSSRERLEQERLAAENRLLEEKVKSFASKEYTERMYKEALDAMRSYSGLAPPEEQGDFED